MFMVMYDKKDKMEAELRCYLTSPRPYWISRGWEG